MQNGYGSKQIYSVVCELINFAIWTTDENTIELDLSW
jgi:hypothetical protein